MLRILASIRIHGIRIDSKSGDGETARDLARQRSGVTSEWYTAFEDLVVSIDGGDLDSSSTVENKGKIEGSGSRMRLSHLIRYIEDFVYEETTRIFTHGCSLSQRSAVRLSALCALGLVLAWYLRSMV